MGGWDFTALLGGLALFLYGMQLLSEGLTGWIGTRMESLLKKCTGNRAAGLFWGAAVTALLQSSSAVTVMAVGFVNSGFLEPGQAVGIIMGANIGTTATSWIFAGKQAGGFWGIGPLACLLAALGVGLRMCFKKESQKRSASVLLGFSILVFGMTAMEEAAAPLARSGAFERLLSGSTHLISGLFWGAVLTAAIQSSSASVGILQAVCESGPLPYRIVIPIILGQNIGTCITALLAGAGARREAKLAAWFHFFYNMIGAALCLALLCLAEALYAPGILLRPADAAGIAAVHSGFNLLSAAVLLPFSEGILALAERFVPAGVTHSNNSL